MQPLPINAAELAQNLASPETHALGCHAETSVNVIQTVRQALAEPLGFDSLSQVTVPGDQIVLAIADMLPCMEQVVEGVVEAMVDVGTDPSDITVLLSEKYRDRLDALQMRSTEPIRWACHDPDEEEAMAYLATTKEGRPIILNRLLTDADLVFPIGCFRTGTVLDHFGIHTPIFPNFTNRETIAEFGSSSFPDTRGRHHKRLVQEIDRIGWLLGITFSIQVIPARAGQVIKVIAGDVEPVRHEAIRSYRQAWHHQISGQTSLVISILDEPATEDTLDHQANWAALVQSLTEAAALVEPDGAIVLLTSLSDQPSPSIQALIEAQDPEKALDEIRNSPLQDASIATRLAELAQHRKIYLMSDLDEQTVEDLRITPIHAESEIIRLSERYATALVLEGAPFLRVEVN